MFTCVIRCYSVFSGCAGMCVSKCACMCVSRCVSRYACRCVSRYACMYDIRCSGMLVGVLVCVLVVVQLLGFLYQKLHNNNLYEALHKKILLFLLLNKMLNVFKNGKKI